MYFARGREEKQFLVTRREEDGGWSYVFHICCLSLLGLHLGGTAPNTDVGHWALASVCPAGPTPSCTTVLSSALSTVPARLLRQPQAPRRETLRRGRPGLRLMSLRRHHRAVGTNTPERPHSADTLTTGTKLSYSWLFANVSTLNLDKSRVAWWDPSQLMCAAAGRETEAFVCREAAAAVGGEGGHARGHSVQAGRTECLLRGLRLEHR